jgi:hypothetical protein
MLAIYHHMETSILHILTRSLAVFDAMRGKKDSSIVA